MSLPTPDIGPAIEGYADVQLQTTCDPTEKPGVAAWRDFVIANAGGHSLGIVRDCGIGGTSEHKEGRALDLGLMYSLPNEQASANEIIDWLLATDAYGNEHAMFRRLGLMYFIWAGQIWSTRYKAWRPYTGPNPHTDHIHFSFGWPGALAQTSFFAWLGTKPSAEVPPVVPPPDTGSSVASKLVAVGAGFAGGWTLAKALWWKARRA